MDYIRKINSVAAVRGIERSICTKSRARVFCKTKFSPPKNCLIELIEPQSLFERASLPYFLFFNFPISKSDV